MQEIKPCPFCGSTNIDYSIKTTGRSRNINYHVQMYCKKCHTYGPRVLVSGKQLSSGGLIRHEVEKDELFKQKATDKWNERKL